MFHTRARRAARGRGLHEHLLRARPAPSGSSRRSSASSASTSARRPRTARSRCGRSSASAAAAGRRSSPSTTGTACTSARATSRRSSRSSRWQTPEIVFAGTDGGAVTELADYEAVGGLTALRRAREMTPDEIIAELNASNLRGRGGAFFPTGRKWSFVPKPDQIPKPHYLVVNADESEPGTFKDREIMLRVPFRFLEGCLIAAHAIESTHVFVYIRGEYEREYEVLVARARADAQGRSSSATSRSSSTAAPARTSAARRPRCSSRSRASAASRGRSRRSPRSPASTRRRPRSTTSSRSRPCRRSSRWAAPSTRSSASRTRRARASSRSPGTSCNAGQLRAAARLPAQGPDLRASAAGSPTAATLKAVIPGGSSTPILTAAEVERVTLDFDSLAAGRDGDRLGGGDRDRRPLLHGAARRPRLAVLRARVVRQVHAVPRRHALADADPQEDRGRAAARRPTSTCCSTSASGSTARASARSATPTRSRRELRREVPRRVPRARRGGRLPVPRARRRSTGSSPRRTSTPRTSARPRSRARSRWWREQASDGDAHRAAVVTVTIDDREVRGAEGHAGSSRRRPAAARDRDPGLLLRAAARAARRRVPHVPRRGRGAAEAPGRLHAHRAGRDGRPHGRDVAARGRRPARDARVHPRQPPARLPGLRQGRRVPAAGPDVPLRAGLDADDVPEDDLRQADPGLAADRARPRALHPLLPLHAVLERRRRGRPADRAEPRRVHRDRDLRRGPVPRAVLGERDRALPGRRADLDAVPLRGAAVGDPGRADRLRALPRRLQHPRDDARGRGQARAVAQPPGDRRRLALRQGPLHATRTCSADDRILEPLAARRARAASRSPGTTRSTAPRRCSASAGGRSSPPSRARRRPRSRTGSRGSCGAGSARTRPSSPSRPPPRSTRSARRSRRSAPPRSWSSSATTRSSTARPSSTSGCKQARRNGAEVVTIGAARRTSRAAGRARPTRCGARRRPKRARQAPARQPSGRC